MADISDSEPEENERYAAKERIVNGAVIDVGKYGLVCL